MLSPNLSVLLVCQTTALPLRQRITTRRKTRPPLLSAAQTPKSSPPLPRLHSSSSRDSRASCDTRCPVVRQVTAWSSTPTSAARWVAPLSQAAAAVTPTPPPSTLVSTSACRLTSTQHRPALRASEVALLTQALACRVWCIQLTPSVSQPVAATTLSENCLLPA